MTEESLKLLAEYDLELKKMRDTIIEAIKILEEDALPAALKILKEAINEKI